MPDGKERSRNLRYKLTPQKTEIQDKKVLILDDSIVRGTTSREIVKMVREFGAKEIYFASACPPIINPCFYHRFALQKNSSQPMIPMRKFVNFSVLNNYLVSTIR